MSGKIAQIVICLEDYSLPGFSFLSFYRTLGRIRFRQDIFSKSWLYEGFQVVKSGRMWPVFLRSEKLIPNLLVFKLVLVLALPEQSYEC